MSQDELLVVAQDKSNPSRYTSTLTLAELLERVNAQLTVHDVYVHRVSPDGAIQLRHVGHLEVAFLSPQDAPLPQGHELEAQAMEVLAQRTPPEAPQRASVPVAIPEDVLEEKSSPEGTQGAVIENGPPPKFESQSGGPELPQLDFDRIPSGGRPDTKVIMPKKPRAKAKRKSRAKAKSPQI